MGIFLKVRVHKYSDGCMEQRNMRDVLSTKMIPLDKDICIAYKKGDYTYLGKHPDGYEVYIVNLRD
jgi:hypothetical protein